MSNQEAAFDDWQAQAQNIVAETQQQKNNEQAVSQKPQPEEKQIEVKPEVIDVKKILSDKINTYKSLTNQSFQQHFENSKKNSNNDVIKPLNQILKNDKDFESFARSVAKRLNDQTENEGEESLPESSIFSFIEETLFLLYNGLEWKNMDSIKKKIIPIKKLRKEQEKQAKKKKEKEERENRLLKQEKQEESKYSHVTKNEDDMFGGAALINSKQEEDERKKKEIIKKVETKVEDDDDDFM